jgi:hypothetical protein
MCYDQTALIPLVTTLLLIHVAACGDSDGDATNGSDSLVEVSVEEAGTNCEFGGQRIAVGVDDGLGSNGEAAGTADDGILDAGEITSTSFICSSPGETGPAGSAGATGATGATGADGENAATRFNRGAVEPGAFLALVFWYDEPFSHFHGQVNVGSEVIDYSDYGRLVSPALVEETLVATPDEGEYNGLSAARLTNGNLVVFWNYVHENSDLRTYFTIVDPSGDPLDDPTRVSQLDDTEWEAWHGELVALSGGGFLFFLDQEDQPFLLYEADGTLADTDTDLISATNIFFAHATTSGSGFAVLFSDIDATDTGQVYLAHFDENADQIGSDIELTDVIGATQAVAFAERDDGSFVAVLQENSQVHALIVQPDGTVDSNVIFAADYFNHPQIALSATGNWLVAHEMGRNDGTAYTVFNEAGEVVIGPRIFYDNEPYSMDATALPDGTFVVTHVDGDSYSGFRTIVSNDGSRHTQPQVYYTHGDRSPSSNYQTYLETLGDNRILSLFIPQYDHVGIQYIEFARGILTLKIGSPDDGPDDSPLPQVRLYNYTAQTLNLTIFAD